MELAGVRCAAAEVTWLPTLAAPVDPQLSPAVNRLIEALEEHDDVREVYSNAEFVPGSA
jgi:transcriptional/translational regulatory protein YebC/TACO1